jgi:hypothetical protein
LATYTILPVDSNTTSWTRNSYGFERYFYFLLDFSNLSLSL